MGALRDPVPAVKDRFFRTGGMSLMIRQNAWQQVDGLDVTEEKSLVFQGDTRIALECVDQLGRFHIGPEARRAVHTGIVMAARGNPSGNLEVQDMTVSLHLFNKAEKDLLELFLRLMDMDIDQTGASVDAVDMLIDGHRNMVEHIGYVIHTVPEIAGAVVHRHHHLIDGTGFPIVICDVFHPVSLPVSLWICLG